MKEVENNESLLDSINDVNIANITAMITETIANSDSNVEDIMNSAIENIMNNIAESNNAETTQVPVEDTEGFWKCLEACWLGGGWCF